MAGLNPTWLAASIATLLALAVPVWAALVGPVAHRLAAVQLASITTSWLLVELCLAFGRPTFLDLAVTLALLSLPGMLVIAVFYERWV